MALSAGTRAPDFRLQATPDQAVSFGDLRGKPVMPAFYPTDWSPICGDQIADKAIPQRVRSDFLNGVRSGANGTPTFFINGARFDGHWTEEDEFLAALKKTAG